MAAVGGCKEKSHSAMLHGGETPQFLM
uniref:Uncharacterized protein n=1 Tax=Arundo donax TaxID=35708 RepID=A0A0A8Z245_ARUDO